MESSEIEFLFWKFCESLKNMSISLDIAVFNINGNLTGLPCTCIYFLKFCFSCSKKMYCIIHKRLPTLDAFLRERYGRILLYACPAAVTQ